jgi:hypothetical protein
MLVAGVPAPYDREKSQPWGSLVAGILFALLFAAVAAAYGCTEYLLARIDPRGSRSLSIILTANLLSVVILWFGSLAVLLASGAEFYLQATIAVLCAQAMWLGQHLWSYYRNHPRLRFEN